MLEFAIMNYFSAAKASLHHRNITRVGLCLNHQILPWAQAGSPSASWYKTTTEYETISIPRSMSRKDAVIVHRLWLGYRCSWEIAERTPRECVHCKEITDMPLTHYLLECDALATIRPQDYTNVQNMHQEQIENVAATCARLILEEEGNLQTLTASPPPR